MALPDPVGIEILGLILTTKREREILLVIDDRPSKLVETVPLSGVSSDTIAKKFADNSGLVYGPPKWLQFRKGAEITSKLLQHVCRILDVENPFMTTYHLQCKYE